jgi:hypothetical protein
MKKFMTIMLALALTTGVATITLAQDKQDDTKKSAKKGKGKKNKDGKTDDSKAPKGGKKGKDKAGDTK